MSRITITKGVSNRFRQIRSNSEFFILGEDYVLYQKEDHLKIRKAGIDDTKTYKAAGVKGSSWILFHCLSKLPLGRFEIDKEESTEDYIIVYFDTQNH